MKKVLLLLLASALLLLPANPAFSLNLFDWGLNANAALSPALNVESPLYPDSSYTAYFYNDMEILGDNTPVPEPAIMLLFGFGLLGLAKVARKLPKKRS